MRFWSGAEVEKSIYTRFDETRKAVDKLIKSEIDNGSLKSLDMEYCYIPIVMTDDLIDLYPPRSRIDKLERRIYNSPQLDFQIFINGTKSERVEEYIRGIRSSKKLLISAGLNRDQIKEFEYSLDKISHHFSG